MSSISAMEPDRIQQIKQSVIPMEKGFMGNVNEVTVHKLRRPHTLHDHNPSFGMMNTNFFGEQ